MYVLLVLLFSWFLFFRRNVVFARLYFIPIPLLQFSRLNCLLTCAWLFSNSDVTKYFHIKKLLIELFCKILPEERRCFAVGYNFILNCLADSGEERVTRILAFTSVWWVKYKRARQTHKPRALIWSNTRISFTCSKALLSPTSLDPPNLLILCFHYCGCSMAD